MRENGKNSLDGFYKTVMKIKNFTFRERQRLLEAPVPQTFANPGDCFAGGYLDGVQGHTTNRSWPRKPATFVHLRCGRMTVEPRPLSTNFRLGSGRFTNKTAYNKHVNQMPQAALSKTVA